MWDFTSLGPFKPRRFEGLRYKVLLIKSAASRLQLSGISLFFKHIYLSNILSRISFLFFPT